MVSITNLRLALYILFPKGCLSTHRVGPLGYSGSHFLGLLVMIFYPPTNRDLYLVGGGGVGGGWDVLPLGIFFGEKLEVFLSFFFKCV